MNLTKAVAENLGKVFLNIGQGMILGSFATGFLGTELQPLIGVVGFLLGGYSVSVGLWLISKLEGLEE